MKKLFLLGATGILACTATVAAPTSAQAAEKGPDHFICTTRACGFGDGGPDLPGSCQWVAPNKVRRA